MQNTDIVRPETLSLPKGGGAISGVKGDVAGAGPDGANSLTLPLPINAGRGYAPSLALSYYSRSGNGPFGMGWNVDAPAIRRRTKKGVPTYNDTDEFLGPNGEVIVPFLADDGTASTRTASSLLGVDLGSGFTVHRYRYRVESDFSRFEYWVESGSAARDFWLLYTPDGQVYLYGNTAQARVSHPEAAEKAGIWLLESSVSATGEQIYWLYRSEDNTGCTGPEITAHPNATAQRYLAAVYYGNRVAGRVLPGLTTEPALTDWLFMVVFDYGERNVDMYMVPDWVTPGTGDWACRQDCFSSWEYGFEIRTRRLCRQVLSYHFTDTLGGSTAESLPQLVSRLLLRYEASLIVTTLVSVLQSGLNANGTFSFLPEVQFGWSKFVNDGYSMEWDITWQEREDLGNLNSRQPYQMVDLNGEGIAGILYQDSGAWWYRAPIRQQGSDANAVTWDKPERLSTIPALRDGGVLADLNGDGYMEWVVTSAGVNGYYGRTPERGWLNFTPLSAYPVEYLHPRSLLVDITGAGLADLALIGPKSVRLYAGTGDGWEKAQDVLQPTGVQLPVPGTNERVLVAFSDMAGSGQQHLVEIKETSFRYWPNLGNGQFGAPVTMEGWWMGVQFIPSNIFLADVDGSGTTDVIIAVKEYLIILINQSGNSFALPFQFKLPDGVHFDNTCELHVADIQGMGIASLILTVPHPKPRHYVCNITSVKPWLLNKMKNIIGAQHDFTYRSSTQFWLDEKHEAAAAGEPVPASYLPFPLHLLARTDVTDLFTGNKLVSTARYRSGAWDGKEREFRGFGYVEIQDTDTRTSQGTTTEISQPSLTRNWFATGLAAIDDRMPQAWWSGDSGAFKHYSTRYTRGFGNNEQVYTPDENEAFWLRRATKGMLLRSELYGLDDSASQPIPYQVSESRPQVRLVVAAGEARYPVVLPINAETRSYVYERVSNDPQCSQQVTLCSDQYGQPLYVMTLNYPRRAKPATSPYPYTLPDTLFDSSYDDQQQQLVVTRQENHWYSIDDMAAGRWVNGLEDAIRSDVYLYSTAPETGLTLEDLSISGAPLGAPARQAFAGWHQPWYLDGNNNPTSELPAFPPRVGLIETAVLDAEMVATLREDLTDSVLSDAGYIWLSFLNAWVVRRNLTTYGPAEHFWLPQTVRDSALTGAITLTRDAYDCVVTKVVDAAGLTTQAEYDWRFLTPVKLTDVNNNIHQVTLDGLGRVNSQRFSGTENGVEAGYSDTDFSPPNDINEALALQPPLPVAQCLVYSSPGSSSLQQQPSHVLVLTTDRYDRGEGSEEQQIRQTVVFSDGFGRELQTSVRFEAGEAWQRAGDGTLITEMAQTSNRWAVSGRTEYDNKGQAIRTYQPYFLNSWQWVKDDSAREDLYADSHYYDPLGREREVFTAKGYLRRTLYTPWFVVSEDENDLAGSTHTGLSPTLSKIIAVPGNILADGMETAEITLTLKDDRGGAARRQPVRFTSSVMGSAFDSVTDNDDGTYSVLLHSKVAGKTEVGVTVNGSTFAITPVMVTLEATASSTTPSIALSSLTASPTNIIANNKDWSTLTFTLKDQNGEPMSGCPVAFSSSLPGVTLSDATDNHDGTYVATLRCTTTGSSSITVVLNGTVFAVAPVTVVFRDVLPPATPDLILSTFTVSADNIPANDIDASTITLTLQDQAREPVTGCAVTFSSSLSGVTLSSVVDNDDGTYVATLRSPITGNTSITVSVNGAVFDVAPVTVIFRDVLPPGTPDPVLSTFTISPDTIPANGTDQATVTLTLKDQHGAPVIGKWVMFRWTLNNTTIGTVDYDTGIYRGTWDSTEPGIAVIRATVNGYDFVIEPVTLTVTPV
ncbi:SpvB/TcaC N-terminal domain-containing protein [Kosakonia sp.]|uniref:SpvB/TcaC N-terminal domain-containing protein n=1 Tax=Kosakonia sp. TaxID=1916651 RepID=UPI0028B02EA1|nr:SpvB/TcaC N-terminal domain-containing protein [Kosakonia sp.]